MVNPGASDQSSHISERLGTMWARLEWSGQNPVPLCVHALRAKGPILTS